MSVSCKEDNLKPFMARTFSWNLIFPAIYFARRMYTHSNWLFLATETYFSIYFLQFRNKMQLVMHHISVIVMHCTSPGIRLCIVALHFHNRNSSLQMEEEYG